MRDPAFYRPARLAHAKVRARQFFKALGVIAYDAFLFACAGLIAGATCALILLLAAERAGLIRIAR